MEELLKEVDSLPLIIKVILCLPCIEIFYGICRIVKGIVKKDALWLLLAILTVFPGVIFMWLIDLIWVLTKGHSILLGNEMFS